ncbi:MAG: hydrogenase maturation protease [Bacteroidetes bacterium]|jgi:hydrogenase maturation protease|nr:hydrogenase maturation protease [Bacteroidota bacterium]
METTKKILIYGYGNPGRQDDGLGNAMIQLLDGWLFEFPMPHVQLDSNYQLNIEDATELKGKVLVIFVDASVNENVKQFELIPVQPTAKAEFTMHATSPGYILHLCEQMFNSHPETWLMQIKGLSWEMKEELTEQAKDNLQEAFEYLKDMIMHPCKLLQEKHTHTY